MVRLVHRLRPFFLLSALFLIVSILYVCDVDHGIAPLPGRLELTVKFLNEPPSNTQGIYLMVAPNFPPHAINELYHSPNSLPIDQDTVYTEIVLPYGHYDAMALWWYSTETESNLADVLAIPVDISTELQPRGFDITPEDPIYQATIIANWRKVDRNANITGTITFEGEWPEDTAVTAVAAFKNKPERNVDYLLFLKSIDFSIDVDENPYQFDLPVRDGSVNYIAVFWLPERAPMTDFQTIGVYLDPENPDYPGKMRLSPGETVSGINIQADWSRITQP